MMKKAAGALAALALFAVGTMMLVGYVRSAEEAALANEINVDVLVVSQPVEAGEPPSVRTEQVPQRLVVDDTVLAVDTLDDLVALVDLVPGEQLLWSRVGAPEEIQSTEPTRVEIPGGFLAVTVPLEPERAFGGLLLPGMRVGVVGSFDIEAVNPFNDESTLLQTTNLLIHKALVVEVQAETPPQADVPVGLVAAQLPEGRFLVTLAVPAYDIERVVFAAEWGTIWLAQEDSDADESGTRIQTADTIFIKPTGEDIEDRPVEEQTRSIAPDVLPLVATTDEETRDDAGQSLPAQLTGDDQ